MPLTQHLGLLLPSGWVRGALPWSQNTVCWIILDENKGKPTHPSIRILVHSIYFFLFVLFSILNFLFNLILFVWTLSLGKTTTKKGQEQLTTQWRFHAKCSILDLKGFILNCLGIYLLTLCTPNKIQCFLLRRVHWDQTEPHLLKIICGINVLASCYSFYVGGWPSHHFPHLHCIYWEIILSLLS